MGTSGGRGFTSPFQACKLKLMFLLIIESTANFVIHVISTLSYFGVFLAMAIESACVPLPSEVIMPFAGYLASKGELELALAAVAGALGNLAGSLLAYWVGARGGRPLVERYGRYLLLSQHDLDVADHWFSRYGKSTVFFTRLLPVVRTFISFPAGISRMRLSTFSAYTLLGALPWSLLLAYIGFKLGQNWDTVGGYFHKADIFIVAFIAAGLIWYVRRHLRNLRRGRQES